MVDGYAFQSQDGGSFVTGGIVFLLIIEALWVEGVLGFWGYERHFYDEKFAFWRRLELMLLLDFF